MWHFADLRFAICGSNFWGDLLKLHQIRKHPIFIFTNIGLHALIQICKKNNFTEEACSIILAVFYHENAYKGPKF